MASGPVEQPVGGQDFFEAQAVARRRRLEVDLSFALAVLAVPALWLLVAVGAFGLAWPVALAVALVWASAMLVPAWLALSRHDGGGGLLALSSGGTPVYPPSADPALVVTRGAAERLDRARLQALVAHEIDHIQSGDMSVNLRVLGWVSGLSALHDAGAALWRSVSAAYRASIDRAAPWV